MNNKLDQVPDEFKQLAEDFSKNGFITTTFENLVNKVKSPGGTTEAGLNSLNDASFDTIILEAIQKATQRSTEISKELNNE